MTETVTEANEAIKANEAIEANEATKANALVRTAKTVKIVSLASRQKKNNIVKKITSISTMAVLVIRVETTVCCTTRTVCSLDVRITTRLSLNRFVDINSCINIKPAKSDPTPGPNPHTLLTIIIIPTIIYILIIINYTLLDQLSWYIVPLSL